MLGDSTGDPGVCGEFDDIERELWSSSREASGGWVPFANLDLRIAARKVAHPWVESERVAESRG